MDKVRKSQKSKRRHTWIETTCMCGAVVITASVDMNERSHEVWLGDGCHKCGTSNVVEMMAGGVRYKESVAASRSR